MYYTYMFSLMSACDHNDIHSWTPYKDKKRDCSFEQSLFLGG